MKLFVQGKGEVILTQKEFVHQGGEGKIFRRGGLAYKVYSDPKKMLPVGKVQELSALDAPNIIRPQDVLLDTKNHPVGYTMAFIQDAFSLCQLFPKAFRRRNGLTIDKIAKLVLRMRETVAYIHSKQVLLVDLNELNFLVDPQFREVYFIDTDSYQTPHFPATALMLSVRDWHAKEFTDLSDWFSFAVVTFQMFVGIHPYRGKHPTHGDNLEKRMKFDISVFAPEVRIPPACEPFDVIPEVWRNWYRIIFAGGRILPPKGMQETVQVQRAQPRAPLLSGKLEFHLLEQFPAEILGVFSSGGLLVALTRDGVYIEGKRYLASAGHFSDVAFIPRSNDPVAVRVGRGGEVELFDVRADRRLSTGEDYALWAKDLMTYEGRLYTQYGGHVQEVQFIPAGKICLTPVQEVATVLEHASQMFPGVVIWDLLCGKGSQMRRHHALIFPASGTCFQMPLPVLDQYRVVDARFESGILMVVGEKRGQYDRFVFRLDLRSENYESWYVPNAGNFGLNFVVLDSGICCFLNEKGKLEIFRNEMNDPNHQTVESDVLQGGFQLYKNGAQLLAAQGDKLYHLSLRREP